MRRRCKQLGLSLMELLMTLAIILILISTLIGVGSYIKTRANLDLTEGMLETLCTALEQYYDDFGVFPPELFNTTNFGDFLGLSVATSSTVPDGDYGFSSAALFYFLDKNPSSRATVETIPNSLVTNKDASGTDIKITIGTNPAIDFPRYIDPWGISVRYEYPPGTAFPVLTGAGPDGQFDTPDDITSE